MTGNQKPNRVVVIGGGIAGLAAAARLGVAVEHCLVLEDSNAGVRGACAAYPRAIAARLSHLAAGTRYPPRRRGRDAT